MIVYIYNIIHSSNIKCDTERKSATGESKQRNEQTRRDTFFSFSTSQLHPALPSSSSSSSWSPSILEYHKMVYCKRLRKRKLYIRFFLEITEEPEKDIILMYSTHLAIHDSASIVSKIMADNAFEMVSYEANTTAEW